MVLNGFGTIINALGQRAKPYLPQICGTIKWRLNNKSAKIRQQVRRRPCCSDAPGRRGQGQGQCSAAGAGSRLGLRGASRCPGHAETGQQRKEEDRLLCCVVPTLPPRLPAPPTPRQPRRLPTSSAASLL